jgi:hypothetical protein
MQRVPRKADGRPPQLVVIVELEELPQLRIVADTFEDEMRLRHWLAQHATRRRLQEALLDALEQPA